MGCGGGAQSRRCSRLVPRAPSSGRPRCETRRSPVDWSMPTAPTGSPSRSTSATAWRWARAGGTGASGVGAEEAIGRARRCGRDDVRSDRDRPRWAPRRARPGALRAAVGLGRGADHRLGRHRLAGRHSVPSGSSVAPARSSGRALYEGRFEIGSAMAASASVTGRDERTSGTGSGVAPTARTDRALPRRPTP